VLEEGGNHIVIRGATILLLEGQPFRQEIGWYLIEYIVKVKDENYTHFIIVCKCIVVLIIKMNIFMFFILCFCLCLLIFFFSVMNEQKKENFIPKWRENYRPMSRRIKQWFNGVYNIGTIKWSNFMRRIGLL
jgi:hypothetical protein